MAKKNNQSQRETKPIDIIIGSNIRQARKEIGITQMALADMLGMTFQQVQKYEQAQNRVSSGTLFDISRITKKPINYFFNEPKIEIISDQKFTNFMNVWKKICDTPCANQILDLVYELGREAEKYES